MNRTVTFFERAAGIYMLYLHGALNRRNGAPVLESSRPDVFTPALLGGRTAARARRYRGAGSGLIAGTRRGAWRLIPRIVFGGRQRSTPRALGRGAETPHPWSWIVAWQETELPTSSERPRSLDRAQDRLSPCRSVRVGGRDRIGRLARISSLKPRRLTPYLDLGSFSSERDSEREDPETCRSRAYIPCREGQGMLGERSEARRS